LTPICPLWIIRAKWDRQKFARQLRADDMVPAISADTVGRIQNNHQLKLWRHHRWLSPKVTRDAAFAA
jgi:hypothetical protein